MLELVYPKTAVRSVAIAVLSTGNMHCNGTSNNPVSFHSSL